MEQRVSKYLFEHVFLIQSPMFFYVGTLSHSVHGVDGTHLTLFSIFSIDPYVSP